MPIIIRGGTIVTSNDANEILTNASLVIDSGRIVEITTGESETGKDHPEIVDARGMVIIPGFVQTHIHLCQTLFRGLADDLQLLDWLKLKIFPMEAAHSESSIYSSALIGILELIGSGTTTILDMGSVNHHEEIIRAIGETGMRAFTGKAMMDINDLYPGLKEPTSESLKSTRDLAEKWHNAFDGRIRYAVAPRFILSCSDSLVRGAFDLSSASPGMLFHTHASENKSEIELVFRRFGMRNIECLDHLGVLSRTSVLAHCVHLSENEFDILQRTQTNVSHCPSSNLKLGSGIANTPEFLSRNISLSLGADGAPCNNSLDMFQEMRLASLIQKPLRGPTSLPAETVFRLATIGGARALGIEDEVGSIETGKKADIVLLNLDEAFNPLLPLENIYSSIVYSGSPQNVDSVMIDGRWVLRKKESRILEAGKVVSDARAELRNLLARVQLR